MTTLEQVFVKEFKSAVQLSGYKDIYKIPLPESSKDWFISGTELYAVKDIEDEYYSGLNKTFVFKVPPDKRVASRAIDKVKRSFLRDEDGNFVYNDVDIPVGSVAITSEKSLGLPYNYKLKGFGYVDFIAEGGEIKEYIYIVPRKYLYRVNQTALVLSVKNMKNFSGMGYTTWDSGKIFLHVIPYRPSANYVGSKVLKTGYGLDYSKEIKEIVEYWVSTGLVPNLILTSLYSGENLALKQTEVGYSDYIPVESFSVGEKGIYGSQEGDISA